MNVHHWAFYLSILGSGTSFSLCASSPGEVPVQIVLRRRGKIRETLSPQDYPQNTSFAALKKKWVDEQKEKDPNYADYKLRLYVKVPASKKPPVTYQEEKIKYPRIKKIKKFWAQVKGIDTHLTVTFEEVPRQARIHITDMRTTAHTVYERVYDFDQTLQKVKEDWCLDRAAQPKNQPLPAPETIALSHYVIYMNRTYLLQDDMTVGEMVRDFAIMGKKPLCQLEIIKNPHYTPPKPAASSPTQPPSKPPPTATSLPRESVESAPPPAAPSDTALEAPRPHTKTSPPPPPPQEGISLFSKIGVGLLGVSLLGGGLRWLFTPAKPSPKKH